MNLRQNFLLNIAQTSNEPLALEFIKAKGVYLFDKEGNKYLDLISGIAVNNLGHRQPKIIKAIKKQADLYLHQLVYGEFIQSPQIKLAKLLVKSLQEYPSQSYGSLDNVYFTNSGTEAVEGAMKLVKKFTGRSEIISFKNAYHGSTQGALSLGEESFKRPYRPLLPAIKKLERNKFSDLKKISSKTAAVFIEPIGGESGIQITEIKYLKELASVCKKNNCLLVFDEIQSGIGRTGKFWAFEHFGVSPDILLTAKALGGGLPLGAFIAPKIIMSELKENPHLGHITTFGGHPLSCAAGYAASKLILKDLEKYRIEEKAELFKKLLQKNNKIKEVRGIGLMLAAEYKNFTTLKEEIDKVLEKGLITDWFLYNDKSMRIAPPLIITKSQIKKACSIINN